MFLILEKKNGVEFFWTETSTPIKEENLCWLEKGKISFELFDPLRFRFEIIFLDSKISVDSDCSHEIKTHLLLGRRTMINLDSVLKSRDITLPIKGASSQSYGFSNSHVWMWELDHKEGWVPKNWCFRTMVLEKTLESPLTASRSNQSILNSLEGLMLKLKLQYSGYLTWRADSGKDHDAGKDWRQEKGATEDETVGWHH